MLVNSTLLIPQQLTVTLLIALQLEVTLLIVLQLIVTLLIALQLIFMLLIALQLIVMLLIALLSRASSHGLILAYSVTQNKMYHSSRHFFFFFFSNQKLLTLRKHAFSNIPKILLPIKNSDIFHIPAYNIDCGYSLE